MASALIGGLLGTVVPGLAGLFGGGKQQKTQTSGTITNQGTQTQSGSQTQNSTANLTHNLSPLQQQLANLFTKGAGDLYNQSTNLQPYESSALQNINHNADLSNKISQNALAARGLSFSPVAGVVGSQNEANRVSQGTQLENSIPLLQRQLQESGLQDLFKAFSALPTDQTTTGSGTSTSNMTGTSNNTQTQNGTNLVSGNPMGGLLGGLGAGFEAPGGLADILSKMFGAKPQSTAQNGGQVYDGSQGG